MTIARRLTTSLVLLLASMTPALAQEPAKLIDPHDRNAVQPGPGIELGFYDPATGLFMRGTLPASTPGREISGAYNVRPTFLFDGAVKTYTTIFCVVTLAFGNVAGNNQFFTNHFARGSVNFAAVNPPKEIAVPFAYTPNSDNARVEFSIDCYGYDDNGNQHEAGYTSLPANLPVGDVTRSAEVDF